MIWPLIWLCTVTVASGVTVPRPMSVMGMSPERARRGHHRHRSAAGKAAAGGVFVPLGVSSQASSTNASNTAMTTSTRRVVSELRQVVRDVRPRNHLRRGRAVFVVHALKLQPCRCRA